MSESSIEDANGLDRPLTGEQPADVAREVGQTAPGAGAPVPTAPAEPAAETDVEGIPFGDPSPASDPTPENPAVRGT